jgi:hypothetical protein
MKRELLLWGISLGCGIGAVVFLWPETYWQRLISIGIFFICFSLPIGLKIAAVYFKPDEKDE